MQYKWNFSTEDLQEILNISDYNFDNMPFKMIINKAILSE